MGASDLDFAELLPEKPAWIQQREDEERTSVGFSLRRLTKKEEALMPFEFALIDAVEHGRPAE